MTDPSMDDNINEQLPAPGTMALLPDCMRQEYKLTFAKIAGDKGVFFTHLNPPGTPKIREEQ